MKQLSSPQKTVPVNKKIKMETKTIQKTSTVREVSHKFMSKKVKATTSVMKKIKSSKKTVVVVQKRKLVVKKPSSLRTNVPINQIKCQAVLLISNMGKKLRYKCNICYKLMNLPSMRYWFGILLFCVVCSHQLLIILFRKQITFFYVDFSFVSFQGSFGYS